jgi:hypothetical protein
LQQNEQRAGYEAQAKRRIRFHRHVVGEPALGSFIVEDPAQEAERAREECERGRDQSKRPAAPEENRGGFH